MATALLFNKSVLGPVALNILNNRSALLFQKNGVCGLSGSAQGCFLSFILS